MRVHHPDVSRGVCTKFDAMVEDVVQQWAACHDFGARQRTILQLPTSRGGMGITRTEILAPAAFEASRSTALNGGVRVSSSAQLAQAIYAQVAEDATRDDPELRRHLADRCHTGTDAAFSAVRMPVHADVFSAHLRTVLMAKSEVAQAGPTARQCVWCNGGAVLDDETQGPQHAMGCVRAKDGLISKRHDRINHELRVDAAAGGMQVLAHEPRDLSRYTCRCGAPEMSYSAFVAHKRVCDLADKVLHHGPDILIWPLLSMLAGGWVCDLTIRCTMAPSYAGMSVNDVFADAVAVKTAKYAREAEAAGHEFMALPASTNGHLGPELTKLIAKIASALLVDRNTLGRKYSALIQLMSAAVRLHYETASGLRPSTRHIEAIAAVRRVLMVKPLDPEHDEAARQQLRAPQRSEEEEELRLQRLIKDGVAAQLRGMLTQVSEAAIAAARAEIVAQRDIKAAAVVDAEAENVAKLLAVDAETAQHRERARTESARRAEATVAYAKLASIERDLAEAQQAAEEEAAADRQRMDEQLSGVHAIADSSKEADCARIALMEQRALMAEREATLIEQLNATNAARIADSQQRADSHRSAIQQRLVSKDGIDNVADDLVAEAVARERAASERCSVARAELAEGMLNLEASQRTARAQSELAEMELATIAQEAAARAAENLQRLHGEQYGFTDDGFIDGVDDGHFAYEPAAHREPVYGYGRTAEGQRAMAEQRASSISSDRARSSSGSGGGSGATGRIERSQSYAPPQQQRQSREPSAGSPAPDQHGAYRSLSRGGSSSEPCRAASYGPPLHPGTAAQLCASPVVQRPVGGRARVASVDAGRRLPSASASASAERNDDLPSPPTSTSRTTTTTTTKTTTPRIDAQQPRGPSAEHKASLPHLYKNSPAASNVLQGAAHLRQQQQQQQQREQQPPQQQKREPSSSASPATCNPNGRQASAIISTHPLNNISSDDLRQRQRGGSGSNGNNNSGCSAEAGWASGSVTPTRREGAMARESESE
jgi:hypothetical protein